MSSEEILSLGIYAESDKTRHCAQITRVGGERFQVLLLGTDGQVLVKTVSPVDGEGKPRELNPEQVAHKNSLDEAREFATAHADSIDESPLHPFDRAAIGAVMLAKDAAIATKDARIAELEAAIAAQAAPIQGKLSTKTDG